MYQKNTFQINGLVPYLMLGIAVAIGIALFILIAYFVIWGIVIGAILWLAVVIKNTFFPKKQNHDNIVIKPGRTIDHKDID